MEGQGKPATPHDMPLRFRDYFLTGLAVILPLWLTVYIIWVLVQITGNLLFPVVRPFLRRILQSSPPEPLLVAIAAAVVCFLIWGLGYLIIHIIGHGHMERIEGLINRIPFVRSIHGVVKRLVEVFLASKSKFQQVVRLEFPAPGQYVIGFVTRQEPLAVDGGPRLIPVLLPTAPNPTSGFLVFVPEDRITYLDVSLDEAMTLIISAGSFGPESLPIKPR